MLFTKYEHSCMVLEQDDRKLVIDPGIYSPSIPILDNVAAIVITHVHPDHYDPAKIDALLRENPNANIYTVSEVSSKISGYRTQAVSPGKVLEAGPFTMEFFGGKHAVISPSYPVNENIGVLVNELFYYGGDQLFVPGKEVKVMALPAVAPWQKISETMDYLQSVKPKLAIPAHNGILSEAGHQIYNTMLSNYADSIGVGYKILEPGESIEI